MSVNSAIFFAASGITAAILPITFSSLKGEYKSSENRIDLTWQAEASLISPGFEVEGSAEGHAFSSIAIMPPQKNLGTSTIRTVTLTSKTGKPGSIELKKHWEEE